MYDLTGTCCNDGIARKPARALDSHKLPRLIELRCRWLHFQRDTGSSPRPQKDAAQDVRFRRTPRAFGTTWMVKVFECRQAYVNRPSTNPRCCGDGLRGFRVLRG